MNELIVMRDEDPTLTSIPPIHFGPLKRGFIFHLWGIHLKSFSLYLLTSSSVTDATLIDATKFHKVLFNIFVD